MEDGNQEQVVLEPIDLVNSLLSIPTGFRQANKLSRRRNVKRPGFWEAVMPSRLGTSRPAWMTFDDAWVDEVRRGLLACKVFLWYPLYCKHLPGSGSN